MKIAIVGTEEHTRHLAPFDDPEYQIWVFNEAANADWCKRWDVCFQLHDEKIFAGKNLKDPNHWEWLQRGHGDKIIYMQKQDPRVPNSATFPLDILEYPLTYKGEAQTYLRMTLSYAIGLAVEQGADQIDVYGVELANSAEYRSQQNCFAFWVGRATGRGVKINLHCCEGMFDKPLYGYEDYMTEEQLQKYMVGLTEQIEAKKRELHMLEGALQLTRQMIEDAKNVKELPQAD